VKTSAVMGLKLSKGDGRVVQSTQYKSLVGSLGYWTIRWPDTVSAVGLVSRYMEEPNESHWLAARKLSGILKAL